MYMDAVAGLSERSRYLRFAAPGARISDRLVDAMMALDGDRHLAFAALTLDERAVTAVARFVRPPGDARSAEVAIAVADAWQHAGLGAVLLQRLIGRARATDLERLTAVTLSENRAAADLARAVGFARVRTAGLYAEFELPLAAAS
jgi:acetyltransferase